MKTSQDFNENFNQYSSEIEKRDVKPQSYVTGVCF